jgi:hypothetical protein
VNGPPSRPANVPSALKKPIGSSSETSAGIVSTAGSPVGMVRCAAAPVGVIVVDAVAGAVHHQRQFLRAGDIDVHASPRHCAVITPLSKSFAPSAKT